MAFGRRCIPADCVARLSNTLDSVTVDDYPEVIVDLDGQPRGELKDRGADKASSTPVVGKLLTPGELLQLIDERR